MEVWKSIPGFPAYEASDEGRIRRIVASSNAKAGQVLKPGRNRNGYYNVSLRAEGVTVTRVVHTIICDTFLGELPADCHRSHINGDKSDNRLANLRFESVSENMSRKMAHGSVPSGARSGSNKLSEAQARSVRTEVAKGKSQAALAKEFGVVPGTISAIVRGRSWRNLSGEAATCH